MLGVIDVGGGLRGAYGAGVFDRCLDDGVRFDYCIGVSAGAANAVSYLAGQHGRNYPFYVEYAQRPQYMSMRNFVRTGSYIDMDYIYGTLSDHDGENPLDYAALAANPAELRIVATEASTGKALYFTKSDMAQDDYDAIKGSCCLPVACSPYPVHGVPCFDGGLADPVPIRKAFADGCDRVVLILTRPLAEEKTPGKDRLGVRLLKRRYPAVSEELVRRADVYNRDVALARQYAAEGRALIVAPESIEGMQTLTRDGQKISHMYMRGYTDAEKIRAFVDSAV